MLDILIRHSIPGFSANFGHFILECLPAVHCFLRDAESLYKPDNVRFWCDTPFFDVLHLYSNLQSNHALGEPPRIVTIDEGSIGIGINRITKHANELRYISKYAHNRFPSSPTDPFILLLNRVTNRRLHFSDAFLHSLNSIMPVKEVAMEQLSFRKQLALVASCRCIVGAHGAGLAWMAFMKKGCVVEIAPRGFLINYFRYYSEILNHAYVQIEGLNERLTSSGNLENSRTRKILRDVSVISFDEDIVIESVKNILFNS